MGFIEATEVCFTKYFNFNGRARRSEYWFFALFTLLTTSFFVYFEGYMGIFPNTDQAVLANIFSLLVIIPSIAVGVRRLHDTNRSGWWYLLIIIPIIGWIVILIWLCKNSDEEDNRFGSNPKYIDEIS